MSGQSTGPTSSYRALTAEVESLRAEVARLTAEAASREAEYGAAIALATDTVRDLTAEADAAREEAVEACARRMHEPRPWHTDAKNDAYVAADWIRATPHSTALRDRIRELEAEAYVEEAKAAALAPRPKRGGR